MTRANFYVYYDGPALAEGVMDVRDLAPALLALGNAFEECNRIVNGERATLTVNIRSGFEKGSFGVHVDVCQTLAAQVAGLFTKENLSTAADIAGVLGFLGVPGGLGLFALLKRAKGKLPKRVTRLEDGNVSLELEEGRELKVGPFVYESYRSLKIRESLGKFLKPLCTDGIEVVKTAVEGKEPEEIAGRDDIPSFSVPEIPDEPLGSSESVKMLSIHSVTFKEDNKWRLSDGASTFWVTIVDEEFRRKVDENLVSFAKGDLLKVQLRVTQWQGAEGLKTEYEAIRVHEHRSAARQIPLALDNPPSKSE
jgi:hypothetical protein